jgi:uncharacterized protein YcaQ
LEHHFGRGKLAVRCRRSNFQRVYDLPERLLEVQTLATRMPKDLAQRQLVRGAAKALGIATLHDLADYYRMSPREAAPRIDELVAAGVLTKVVVEGWAAPAYLDDRARIPRQIRVATLLSPFDPVLWYRPRTQRLFDFEYRIEIYIPAGKRRWGYYVLPFLEGERITARVDLKADRKNSELLVQAAYLENKQAPEPTATALAIELCALSVWLELRKVVVKKASAFAKRLARHVEARA